LSDAYRGCSTDAYHGYLIDVSLCFLIDVSLCFWIGVSLDFLIDASVGFLIVGGSTSCGPSSSDAGLRNAGPVPESVTGVAGAVTRIDFFFLRRGRRSPESRFRREFGSTGS
jgi:hypothetical protein